MKAPDVPAWLKLAAPDHMLKTGEVSAIFGYPNPDSFRTCVARGSFPEPDKKGQPGTGKASYWRADRIIQEIERRRSQMAGKPPHLPRRGEGLPKMAGKAFDAPTRPWSALELAVVNGRPCVYTQTQPGSDLLYILHGGRPATESELRSMGWRLIPPKLVRYHAAPRVFNQPMTPC
jgi:hypothetical protein